MTFRDFSSRISQLPLILVGPIVRRVTPRSASIWLITSRSVECTVEASQSGRSVTGTRASIAIARHLHLCLVTVTDISSLAATNGLVYYDVVLRTEDTVVHRLNSPGVLAAHGASLPTLGYNGSTLPSFLVPPSDYRNLRLIHASCRATTGVGADALGEFDSWMSSRGDSLLSERPHLLWLTGDQIYADSVSPVVGSYAYHVARILAGSNEPFIGDARDGVVFEDFRFDRRAQFARDCGITSDSLSGHALRFTEYLVLYILAWSPVLWPERDEFPWPAHGSPVWGGPEREARRRAEFQGEIDRAMNFATSTTRVRRVLANVSTLMLFDDHEVTDDWNIDSAWLAGGMMSSDSRRRELAQRYTENALLAYLLCQHIGNVPSLFAGSGPAGSLLQVVQTWAAAGYPIAGRSAWVSRLGMPNHSIYASSGKLVPAREDVASQWHFSVTEPEWNYELLGLDCRTRRTFRDARVDGAPTPSREIDLALLDPDSARSQVSRRRDGGRTALTIVAVSQPVLTHPAMVEIKRTGLRLLSPSEIHVNDLSEGWELDDVGIYRLFLGLAQRSDNAPVVLLSGDIHFAYTARALFQYYRVGGEPSSTTLNSCLFVQCVSSGALKQDANTISLHNNHIPFGFFRRGLLNTHTPSQFPTIESRVSIPHPRLTVGINSAMSRILHQLQLTLGVYALENFVGYTRLLLPTADSPGCVVFDETFVPGTSLPGDDAIQGYYDWWWRSDMIRGARQDQRSATDGTIIVGLNNVGRLSFSQRNGNSVVRHELFWIRDGRNEPAQFRTLFEVALNTADPIFPMQRLPSRHR